MGIPGFVEGRSFGGKDFQGGGDYLVRLCTGPNVRLVARACDVRRLSPTVLMEASHRALGYEPGQEQD
ncbi:hypothetical protein KAM484_30040 [Aeromonas caviae]|jgi:hypothetical protein|nr:hypothetical protein KAM467_33210 [Aeromonas caviae]GKR52975.1 hypothetical protein KAM475_21220 [Aeromonas caviae]GKR92199.1 hypothetical protein KAM484_30040 [Aeromonas caviae]